MKPVRRNACLFGFEPSVLTALKESVYFAGAEPNEVEDVSGITRLFKTEPPDLVVLSLEAFDMLEFHVMVGGNPQFDKVAVVIGARDVAAPGLRKAIETCASDFFLVAKPYHLKRLVMAVMAQNPWSEVPVVSGKLLVADGNLERRIAMARALRVAKFDVEFCTTTRDLRGLVGKDHTYRMVIAAARPDGGEAAAVFADVYADPALKKVPWLVYDEELLLANVKSEAPGELVQVGNALSPDAVAFHVQTILSTPLKDLRKSERLPYLAPVRFVMEKIREEVWGFATDISENGLYVRTIVPPPTDTVLTVSFTPPTGEGLVQMGARVAWRKEFGDACFPSKQPGFGVEFVRASAPDRAGLVAGYQELLAALRPGGGEAPKADAGRDGGA